jgi:hypothetical protein
LLPRDDGHVDVDLSTDSETGPAVFDGKWWSQFLVSNPQLVLGPQPDVPGYPLPGRASVK